MQETGRVPRPDTTGRLDRTAQADVLRRLAAQIESAAGHGVALLDAHGRVTFASPAFARLAGVTHAALLSAENLAEALADDAAEQRDALRQLLAAPAATTLAIRAPSDATPLLLRVERLRDDARLALLLPEEVLTAAAVTAERCGEAQSDPLTGLGNRALFDRLMARVTDSDGLALLLIDLDRFKQVNDTLGHEIGDELLVLVAKRLRAATRGDDPVIRLGGDEFAILLTLDGDPGVAVNVAERVVDLLGRAFLVAGQPVHIGASVGIAALGYGTACSRALFRHADLALYAAKNEGGAGVRFFEPRLESNARARRQMELELRRALTLRQLELHYQPQVLMPDMRLAGFEALLRWRHPEHGMLPPVAFIPLAEEIGEIVRIGRWVLEQACADAMGWPEDLSVAVNVSALQFEQHDFVDVVRGALEASGLPARRLEIEITESVLLAESPEILQRLEGLRDLGVSIALDDFGTGYCSLSYLNRFDFSKLKIDRSFIQRGSQDARSGELVRQMLSLGASLGMRTVAEGVETDAEYRALLESGCQSAQGFLFGAPIPQSDLEAFIARVSNDRGEKIA